MYVHRPPLVVDFFLVPWCVVNKLSESSSIVVGDMQGGKEVRWRGMPRGRDGPEALALSQTYSGLPQ